MAEPTFIAQLKEPRPSWWRFKARRRYDRRLSIMSALVNEVGAKHADEIHQATLNLMLYGRAEIPPQDG